MIKQNDILNPEDRLNMILEKISKLGIKTLDKDEVTFLESYSIGNENETNKKISEKENKNLFLSDDGIFKFRLKNIECIEDIKYINGLLTVPDMMVKKRTVKGELKGSILVFVDGSVAMDFSKGKYDVFEFIIGLEYELDCFVDDLVSKLSGV